MTPNRNVTLDLVRALSILWIVCIWHLTDYCTVPFLNIKYGDYFTKTCLSLLFWISGLFNGRHDFSKPGSWASFFLKRLFRLYIPFFIASFLLLLVDYPCVFYKTSSVFVTSLIPGAALFVRCPSTVWYVMVLLVFYLVTPILANGSTKKRVITSIFCLMLFVSVCIYFDGDSRVYKYFVFYDVGTLTPIEFVTKFSIKKSNKILEKIIRFISYASMMMYLLHRQIYWALVKIDIVPIALGGAISIFVSYYMQKLYDSVIQKICSPL